MKNNYTLPDMINWDFAKNYTRFKLVRANTNTENLPYRKFLDLKVIYKLETYDHEKIYEINIDSKIMEYWGINEEILYNQTVKNFNQNEVIFTKIEDMIFGSIDENILSYDGFPSLPHDENLIDVYVLSKKFTDNGASMIVYPQILEYISKKYGSYNSFILIPSSVHEVLLFFNAEQEDMDMVTSIVNEVNGDDDLLKEEEILSNHSYFFDNVKQKWFY